MDNKSFLNLKNRLAALPVLEERLKKVQERIQQARNDVENLLRKYEKEALDVERIREESFSSVLLKLAGRYEKKLDKEVQEMIRAKAEYDAACIRLAELEQEAVRLKSSIDSLVMDRRVYMDEFYRRESLLRNGDGELSRAYRKLCGEAENLSRQLAETEEALGAARRAYDTALSALDYLHDADGWATYDVLFSRGLMSHMAKYDKIDKAQEAFERLNAQLEELQLELNDIHLHIDFPPVVIDPATRFFDYWLDNIFTDIRVRNLIREYMEYAKDLLERLKWIIDRLVTAKRDLIDVIRRVEERQEEMIISFEAGE